MRGRIRFAGNPWPEGHAVRVFRWGGRIDHDGVFFDLHLESSDYDAGGEGKRARGDDEWASPDTWKNYRRCVISSTEWGEHRGLRVVDLPHDGAAPDLASLVRRPLRADPLPLEGEPSFGIYLLGHDSVASHLLRFTKRPRSALWDVVWKGRIALAYAGEDEHAHRFEAAISGARFEGFDDARAQRKEKPRASARSTSRRKVSPR